MNKAKRLLLITYPALLFLAGCAEQQQYKPVEQICVPKLEKSVAIQAAEEVLGQMHFTIEKSDAEQGYIKTRPLTGAQFFEFWRSDNFGALNWSEANLHTIRRTVELDINQKGEQLCINCDVKTQRLSLPERQDSSRTRAYAMFSASKPSMQRLELHPEQKKDMAWVDLGNDTKLGTEILKRIEKQMAKQ